MEGKELIAELVRDSGSQVDIMAGGGVDSAVIRKMLSATKASSYHMSGKTVLSSAMTYRKQGVSMGVQGFSEYEIFRPAEEKIRAAMDVLDDRKALEEVL